MESRQKCRMFSGLLVVLFTFGVTFSFAGGQSEEGELGGATELMWWGDDARHEATNAAARAFEEAFPDVSVETMPNPFDGYQTMILIELASGTAPDVFKFSTEWLPDAAFEEEPVIADLYEWTDILDLSGFSDSILSGGEVNGRLVGVPTGISGWVYTYQKDVLEEFAERSDRGLPPGPDESWTVDEFIEYGRDFRDTMGENYALLTPGFNPTVHQLVSVLSEIAGTFYMSPTAEMQFSEQDLVDTFSLFGEFTDAGILPDGELQVEAIAGDPSSYNASGEWAGYFAWTSNIPEQQSISGDEHAVMAYPTIGPNETNDGIFVRPAQFWMVYEHAENPEIAVELLNFIVNDPAAIRALELQRGVPATSEGQQILADDGVLEGIEWDATQYLQESANANYNPFIIIPELRETLRDEYTRFITGQKSAEEAAADLYPELERITSTLRSDIGLE